MKKHNQQNLKNQPHLSGYKIINKIGEGLSAQVYLAKHEIHGQVSIKAIQPSFYGSKFGAELINNEIQMLKTVSHKNILKFIEVINKENKIYIVTEFCEGKNLESYIHKNNKLSQKKALEIFQGIAEGCLYLKEKQIVHRDLKPSNIFFKNSQPIIADFGFSTSMKNEKLLKLNAGSPLYMPYESLVNKIFSQKSDIFALGVIFFEMLTGKTPWQAKSQDQLKRKLKTLPIIPKQISSKVKDLILDCLAFQSKQRPNLQSILSVINKLISENPPKQPLTSSNENEEVAKKEERHKKSLSFALSPQIKVMKENKQNIPPPQQIRQEKGRCISLIVPQNPLPKQKAQIQNNFLQNLDANEFTFLPSSLISKFDCILQQYKKVMGISSANMQYNIQCQDNDQFILQIKQCSTQLELCRKIQSFIRRLFRLTKNYKQYRNCLGKLQKMCKRMQSVIL